MMASSTQESFNALLTRWVAAETGKPVCSASIDTDLSNDEGCDTCGYGGGYSFDILYYVEGDPRRQRMPINDSPLSWLAYTLFSWEEGLSE